MITAEWLIGELQKMPKDAIIMFPGEEEYLPVELVGYDDKDNTVKFD